MSKRAIIFSGGRIGDWAFAMIRPDDTLIGADAGALSLIRNRYRPDAAIGDFDSVAAADLEAIRREAKTFVGCDNVDKDWTDTELAFDYAVKSGADVIVVVGGLGTRFDHSLANVHLLSRASSAGIRCSVEDEYNRVELVRGGERLIVRRDRFDYVSLLPLSSVVEGIDLEGFQYPLRGAALSIGESLGISNRLLADEGTVTLGNGELLVISSRD